VSRRLRVVVVGAGAWGAVSAQALALRGHDVRLVDRAQVPHPAASSTDTSRAVRSDYGDDDGFTALAKEAIRGWRRWNREWSWAPFRECGFLFLTESAIEDGSFEAESLARHRAAGVEPERLGAAALAARFPQFASGTFADGYLSPSAGYADSGRVVAELVARARDAGVDVATGAGVAAFREDGARVTGVVLRDDGEVRADVVVVAAGAWTPSLLPELGEAIVPHGQTLLYFRPDRPERFAETVFPVWSGDISRTGWYGFPADARGLVKVGHHGPGRPTAADDERRPDPAIEAAARTFLARAVPELSGARLVRMRECLYADAWDGAFYLDRHPDRHGVVVAAGGSGHGFKFTPVIGSIVADLVEGRDVPAARRFAWRAPGATRVERARVGGGAGDGR